MFWGACSSVPWLSRRDSSWAPCSPGGGPGHRATGAPEHTRTTRGPTTITRNQPTTHTTLSHKHITTPPTNTHIGERDLLQRLTLLSWRDTRGRWLTRP